MIVFVVKLRRDGSPQRLDPFQVFFQSDLQDFMEYFDQLPALKRLASLDIYDGTDIEGQWLLDLQADLQKLIRILEDGGDIEGIPERVGYGDDQDTPESFGRYGFLKWARKLKKLCGLAIERDTPLLAAGD